MYPNSWRRNLIFFLHQCMSWQFHGNTKMNWNIPELNFTELPIRNPNICLRHTGVVPTASHSHTEAGGGQGVDVVLISWGSDGPMFTLKNVRKW